MSYKIKIEFSYPVGEAAGNMLSHSYARELQRRGAAVKIFDSMTGEQAISRNNIDCLDCSHLEVEIIKYVDHRRVARNFTARAVATLVAILEIAVEARKIDDYYLSREARIVKAELVKGLAHYSLSFLTEEFAAFVDLESTITLGIDEALACLTQIKQEAMPTRD